MISNVEVLFNDHLVVVAGMRSRWARRRKIDLAELVNEPWILATPGSGPHTIVSEAFRARGLSIPNISLMTLSVLLRANMVASGQFITTFQISCAPPRRSVGAESAAGRFTGSTVAGRNRDAENRTLSPEVKRFIDHVRDFTRPMREGPPGQR